MIGLKESLQMMYSNKALVFANNIIFILISGISEMPVNRMNPDTDIRRGLMSD